MGACYLVAVGAQADWSGKDGAIACFTAGGWRFVQPIEGLSVTVEPSGVPFHWRSGAWEAGIARFHEVRIAGQTVLRERQSAVPDPVGGAVIDGECRAALAAILGALRTHGLIS